MNKVLTTLAVLFAIGLGSISVNASVLPVGVLTDVSKSTVQNTWGWSECYSTAGNSYGDSISGILAGCNGDSLMMATYITGSSNYEILAAASFADVTFDVGTGTNATHTANGSEWYFSDTYSWGFTELGNSVYRQSCDTELTRDWAGAGSRNDNVGMCWHTNSGVLSSGWRYNKVQDGIESSVSLYNNHVRVLLVNNVPEPWSLSLLGLGLAGLGLRRSRRTKQL